MLSWRARTPERYAAAFERALRSVRAVQPRMQAERAAAHRRALRLLGQPPARRRLLVDNHPGYAGWWLASLLLDEAELRLDGEPRGAVRLAGLAGEALDEVALDAAMVPLAADLRARACRLAADGHRRLGDVAAARRALAAARRHLRDGSGEPLERALLVESRGNLLALEGRTSRAEALLAAAADRFRRLSDHHFEGRARVAAGLLAAGDSEGEAKLARAAAQLRRGLSLLDPRRDRGLAAEGARRLAEVAYAEPPPVVAELALSASPLSA